MRIHLPLHPHHFQKNAIAGPSSSPLIHLGGELVIMELQGELGWEGDNSNGVVGVLGLDRPDKPTLYLGEHHLLHGKMSTLAKPYAVIRRVVGGPNSESFGVGGDAIDGDAQAEEEDEEEEAMVALDQENEDKTPAKMRKSENDRRRGHGDDVENDDEENEGPLFAPNPSHPSTPQSKHVPSSSSPYQPPSSMKDYSSELDMSSPARGFEVDEFGFEKRPRSNDDDDDDDEAQDQNGDGKNGEVTESRKKIKMDDLGVEKSKKKKVKDERERTRHYEVVGVVRKKVVFALRPEPIVTATVLPE